MKGLSHISAMYGYLIKLLILVVVSCVAISANADEAGKEHQHEISEAHKQNVEQMLVLMNMPAQVDNAAQGVVERYSATVDPDKADKDLQKLITAYQKDLEKIILPTLGWGGLKTTYIYSYSKRLDEQEVAQITNFYSSVAGKKFIEIQSDATTEIQKITSHLVESDIQAPLAKLANMLKEGLKKHRTLKTSER